MTIEKKLRAAMTVADLIEALAECDPEARVVFADDYGDHGHTVQALLVREVETNLPAVFLTETAYSASGLALAEDESGEEASVVVLS